MPKIPDAAAARKLRDTMITKHTYERTKFRRKVRDRNLQTELAAFAEGLSENIKKAFVPWMDQEPDAIIRKLKHTLISNPIELEVLTRDEGVDQQIAQDFELAMEAILEHALPVNVQLLEQDGALGDGWAIGCVEQVPTNELAPYADRKSLEAYADSDDPDDEDANTPRMQYRQAHRQAREKRQQDPTGVHAGTEHDEAYRSVTDNARRQSSEFPWQVRICNNLAAYAELGRPGEIEWALEDGMVPVSAIKSALEGYGYELDPSGKWVLKNESGERTNQEAFLVGEIQAHNREDALSHTEADKLVRYTRIATKDEIAILVEHCDVDDKEKDPGALMRFPNPFGGRYCGYVLIPGDERNRPTWEERFVPPVEGMYVVSFLKAYVYSAAFAMLAEEAMRDVTAIKANPKVPPVEGSQNARVQAVKQGRLPASVDELQRTPTTGLAVLELAELLDKQADVFRWDDYMTGVGSSGDTGIALARLQTKYLTELQPYQQKRALAYKQILHMITVATAQGEKPLFIPYIPKGTRDADGAIQVAQILELTPDMARMPFEIRVTIGAESPETKFAREQALRAQQAAKIISRTTVQEGSGVKDPGKENRRIAKDAVFEMLIAGDGNVPGSLITFIAERLQQRIQERIDRRLPPPPPALAPPPPPSPIGPDGFPLPAGDGDPAVLQGPGPVTGAARLPNPVQTDPTSGVPVAGGGFQATV